LKGLWNNFDDGFSQVVYDRLIAGTYANTGEVLFEKIISYGGTFVTLKVQAADNEGNSVFLDGSVFQAKQCVEPETFETSVSLQLER